MQYHLLDWALNEVKEDFTEGVEDDAGRDLRAICGTKPGVRDAAGSDGKHLLSGQAERGVSCCGRSPIRTGVAVFHIGRCDQLGRVPDYSVDKCGLWAFARSHSGIGQGAVRQAQWCRAFDIACSGAAFGERSGSADWAHEGMPWRVVA